MSSGMDELRPAVEPHYQSPIVTAELLFAVFTPVGARMALLPGREEQYVDLGFDLYCYS